ncbi:MAG: phage head morphogenesis protein [Janthinobacterium lividum]
MIRKNIRKGTIIPYPVFEEERYRKDLFAMIEELQAIIYSRVINNSSFAASYNTSIRTDEISDELDAVIEYIKVRAAVRVLKLINDLSNRAEKINKFNHNAFINFINNSLDTNIPNLNKNELVTEEMKLWALENAQLIRSIPNQILDKLSNMVCEAVRNGNSLQYLGKNLERTLDISRNRAKIIARDQVAKLNGTLTKYRNLNLGITEYKWLTSGDERVRHSHDVLRDKICSWQTPEKYRNNIQDKLWKKRSSIKGVELHPGLDIMCRCTSIAIL